MIGETPPEFVEALPNIEHVDGDPARLVTRMVPLSAIASYATGSLNMMDAQAAYESVFSLWALTMGGCNFIMHGAGWLEGGLSSGYEKLIMDADQLTMFQKFAEGVDFSENGQAMDAIREVGPGKHFLGCAHTQANFETAFYQSTVADYSSYEQWSLEGSLRAEQRANQVWKKMLAEYVDPGIDPALEQELQAFFARRKEVLTDDIQEE